MTNRLIVTFAVAATMCGTSMATAVSGQGTWETTLQSRDFDGDGAADAFYDISLDLTWMRRTLGPMSWDGAGNALAYFAPFDNLTGWRLPTTQPTYDLNPEPTSGEMTHLWYITLGNKALFSPLGAGPLEGGGLTNTGDFQDLQPNIYWTGTQLSTNPNSTVFLFRMDLGYNTSFGNTPNDAGLQYAIFVHAGDIGVALVPEPQSLALLVTGLCGLAVIRRRRID